MLTREEFLDLFLDDLELPDLAKRRLAVMETEGLRRAGYTVTGSPANLSLTRTMRNSMSRRIALKRPKPEEIAALEARLDALPEGDPERPDLEQALLKLRERAKRIPYVDPIDLRFRRFEPYPQPIAQAVMFCLMDVSGSMTEHMKDLAKRFFILLHIFLTRRYRHVEIVFIRHTDQATEVDEETFFDSRETGGTLVSSALDEMKRIVAERYPATTGTSTPPRPRTATTSSDGADRDGAAAVAHPAGLPVFRLSRGRRRERPPRRLRRAPHDPVADLRGRSQGRRADRHAQGQPPERDLPRVPRAVRPQGCAGRGGGVRRATVLPPRRGGGSAKRRDVLPPPEATPRRALRAPTLPAAGGGRGAPAGSMIDREAV